MEDHPSHTGVPMPTAEQLNADILQMTLQNTLIRPTSTPSVYRPTLTQQINALLRPADHLFVVLYSPDDSAKYPLMASILANKGLIALNGGVRVDLDFPEVGSYAVYKRNDAKTFELRCWADFDHWPLDDAQHVIAGLADGHYHAKPTNTAMPATDQMRALLVRLVAYLRSGGITF